MVGPTPSRTGRKRTSRVSPATIRRVVAGVRGTIVFDEPLQKHTSFKIGGPADVLVEPVDVEDVARLVKQASADRVPVFVLGGTNLLIRDGGIRGVVISLSKLRVIREEPGHDLYAEGGVGIHRHVPGIVG